ncbi:hypothetical protein ES702_05884 [subsurface metagenome]
MILPVVSIMALAYVSISTRYDNIIQTISVGYKNNPNLIKALIKVESNFRPDAHRCNEKEDSRGLGQINRPTAIALERDPEQLFNPSYNIVTINLLILDLKKRYSRITDIIAAYNAGSVKKTKEGRYINNSYVNNVYARFLLYSYANIIPDIIKGGI